MIRGMIFDLDGTLVDTLDDIADAMNQVLQENQLPLHERDEYKYLVGEGIYELTRKVLPVDYWSEANAEMFVGRFRQIYETNWHAKSLPYPGIPEMLHELAQQGVLLGILSNKPDAFVQKIIAWFFGDVTFKAVSGQHLHLPTKPDPYLANQIAGEFGIPAHEIAFVGDSGIDIQTGVNAGMFPVGVAWGFRPKRELLETGARFYAESAADLIQLVKDS